MVRKKSYLPFILMIIALPFSGAFADSGPGCGVGTMLWKGQSGLLAHTSAATTNGSTWNQWFGLSSGTLDCNPEATVQNDFQRKAFVASNLDNLSQEIAQGQGDHLTTLAVLMGIDSDDQQAFFSMAQGEYGNLFETSASDFTQVLAVLEKAMLTNPGLSKYIE